MCHRKWWRLKFKRFQNPESLSVTDLRGNKREERRDIARDINFPNDLQKATWVSNKWKYSGSNKVLTATDPLGFTTKNVYDMLDRLTSTEDAEGRVTKYEYDTDLRITKVIDANNVDADIRTYTANGKLYTIKDARNNISTYTYDGHDRKSRLTYPDTSYEEWQYDANGNVTSYRTRSGTLITQTFDDYDRLLTRSPASQATETYAYDDAGRLLSVSTPVVAGNPATGTFSRGYDAAGRLTSETNPQSQTLSYQLDGNGNVTKITYPDGYYVTREFDEINRLKAIKLNGSTSAAATFTYDRLSRRTQMAYLNGVATDYQYDVADRRIGMDVSFSGAAASWRYGYNKVDQMTSQRFPDSTWEWRPASVSSTAYGAANNLNQILTAGAATLSYADGRGNLTGDGTWTYTYNTENMLTGATKTGVTVSFDYDGANRQIRKTVGSTKTRFVYSGDQLLAEYNDATSALLKRYVYALGKDDPIMAIDASNNVTYLHADHLGSIIAQTNSSGVIVNKYQYSPHGQSVSLAGTTFGFTGQRFDSDLGLYHYKARYYSPALSRFLQADPGGYDVSYNLYPYAKNDPLNIVDPTGFEDEDNGKYRKFGEHSDIPWWLDFRPRMNGDDKIPSPAGLSLDLSVGAVAGAIGSSLAKTANKVTGAWKSGPHNKIGVPGDGLDRHHFPQQEIGKNIPGYNHKTGPAVLVPERIHENKKILPTVGAEEARSLSKNQILGRMANEARALQRVEVNPATTKDIFDLYQTVRKDPSLRKYLFKN